METRQEMYLHPYPAINLLEGQELWTRTPQSTSLTTEQEWSVQMPAAVRQSETEEWHGQPLQPLQILDALRLENSVPIVCGTGGMKIHHSDGKFINGAGMNELPASQGINKIVIGINGAAGNPAMTVGIPAMTGIGGHPGLPELMMKGGPRGHHGHFRFFLNRKSTSTKVHILSGTEASQRRPGEITVVCGSNG